LRGKPVESKWNLSYQEKSSPYAMHIRAVCTTNPVTMCEIGFKPLTNLGFCA